jgi:hypothetical protein
VKLPYAVCHITTQPVFSLFFLQKDKKDGQLEEKTDSCKEITAGRKIEQLERKLGSWKERCTAAKKDM